MAGVRAVAFALGLFVVLPCVVVARYTPDWKSVDARPLPGWYDKAKVGIFLHWGVFSVPSWGTDGGAAGEWYWWKLQGAKDPAYIAFHNKSFGADFQYQEFAPQFRAEMWDPDAWAALFKASGIEYVVLTSKHHEGYCNWPSAQSWNWNSKDVGPGRDLVGELAAAVRKQGITFGLYHSLFEWFHPLYLADKASNFTTRTFVDEVTGPQLRDIVQRYQPEVIWSDGDWEAPDEYWGSVDFLAWLYNDSPVKDTVVVNDRWGKGSSCVHGGYWSCQDRYNPGTLQKHKWENAFTIDTTTWGYNRNSPAAKYLSPAAIVSELVSSVACGGNVLVNVGPTHDGRIVPAFEERLRAMGAWLAVNGDAIYASTPWRVQNETASHVWYTAKLDAVFAIVTEWPTGGASLLLEAPRVATNAALQVSLLGLTTPIAAHALKSGGVVIDLPRLLPGDLAASATGSAWVFKLDGVQ